MSLEVTSAELFIQCKQTSYSPVVTKGVRWGSVADAARPRASYSEVQCGTVGKAQRCLKLAGVTVLDYA